MSRTLRTAAALLLILLPVAPAFGWGDDAHRAIVRGAAAALPGRLGLFLQTNTSFLAWHSTDPDYIPDRTPEQRAEHFLDMDLYPNPAAIPHSRSAAERQFGREAVIERGLLPWTIEREYRRVVAALKAGDWEEARLAAAHLSHFVADAHMPLHATSNYDGQKTGNSGIHGRIEYELVPRYHGATMILAGEVARITDPLEWAFAEINESFTLIQSLLDADTAARKAAILDSEAFYAEFEGRAGSLLEQRLRDAATALASLYLSAWEEAGRPDLPPKRVFLVVLDNSAAPFETLELQAVNTLRRTASQADEFDAVALIAANSPRRQWQFTVPTQCAKDAAERPLAAYAGSVNYALNSALLVLKRFPGAERNLTVYTDGWPDKEHPTDVAEVMKELGVRVEVRLTTAPSEDASSDARNVRKFAREAGATVKAAPAIK